MIGFVTTCLSIAIKLVATDYSNINAIYIRLAWNVNVNIVYNVAINSTFLSVGDMNTYDRTCMRHGSNWLKVAASENGRSANP